MWKARHLGINYRNDVRDLLIFNLFLQFSDGIVSYQAFALGAAEANPVVAAAISKLGYGLGINLQQNFGVCAAASDICTKTQSRLTGNGALTVTASVYVCATIVFLWELLR